jgi:FkbM family methyltransferase
MRARWRDQRGEIRAVRELLPEGGAAVDVGANKGAYTFWMRRAVGKSGKVIAVEPQPELAAYLRSVCRSMHWDNVRVLEAAASERTGAATLRVPGSGVSPGATLESEAAPTAGWHELRCETVRLDDALAGDGRIALMKVDVEGHELAVFRGAARILTRDRPALLFECEQRHLSGGGPADCFAFLAELGYSGAFFSPRGLRPVSEFDPSIHQPRSPGRFWKSPRYVNNFLFTATPSAPSVFES